MPEVAPYNFQTAHDAVAGLRTEQGEGVYGLGAHPGLRDGDGRPEAAGAERISGGRELLSS